MNTAAYVIIAAVVAVALYFGVRQLVRIFSKVHGSRTVTCPETGKPVNVEVDAVHATFTGALGRTDIRLQDCSRWPDKKDCGQQCLLDLDVAPADCLVSGVLTRWYGGKNCVYCKKAFEVVQWTDHRPALLTPEGKIIEWREVSPENLLTALETHFPVCWDCYIAQTFRAEHPDLVVYRPMRNSDLGDTNGSSVSRHP